MVKIDFPEHDHLDDDPAYQHGALDHDQPSVMFPLHQRPDQSHQERTPLTVKRTMPGMRKSLNGECSRYVVGIWRSDPVGSWIKLHPPKRAPVPLNKRSRQARIRKVFICNIDYSRSKQIHSKCLLRHIEEREDVYLLYDFIYRDKFNHLL